MSQSDSLSNPSGGSSMPARLRRSLAKASGVVFSIASNLFVNNNKSPILTTTVQIEQQNLSSTEGIAELVFVNNNTRAGMQLTNSSFASSYAGMLEVYGDGVVISSAFNPVLIDVQNTNTAMLSFRNDIGYKASFYHGQCSTTDTSDTTCGSILLQSDTTYMIEARVVARRTGGSAGTADDGATFIRRAMYTTKSGTVTLTGAVESTFDRVDVAGYAARLAISGSAVVVSVNGKTNTNIDWNAFIMVSEVG